MDSKTVHDVLVDNLRRLMFERKMTQEKLAEAAKIQRSSLSLILGGTDPKLSTLIKLASALGVEPWALIKTPEVATAPEHDGRQSIVEAIAVLLEHTRK